MGKNSKFHAKNISDPQIGNILSGIEFILQSLSTDVEILYTLMMSF
ncbi:hypothetical protein [Gilliamella apis]|nr:hypothetical protein [Gilliamella apis]